MASPRLVVLWWPQKISSHEIACDRLERHTVSNALATSAIRATVDASLVAAGHRPVALAALCDLPCDLAVRDAVEHIDLFDALEQVVLGEVGARLNQRPHIAMQISAIRSRRSSMTETSRVASAAR